MCGSTTPSLASLACASARNRLPSAGSSAWMHGTQDTRILVTRNTPCSLKSTCWVHGVRGVGAANRAQMGQFPQRRQVSRSLGMARRECCLPTASKVRTASSGGSRCASRGLGGLALYTSHATG